ncbi:hypothetical protein SRHO_G00208380 [Serrasalmus rhombeus]
MLGMLPGSPLCQNGNLESENVGNLRRPHCEIVKIMRVLCLISLMLLAHSSLVQSVFKQVNIHCDHASNETAACLHNDSCNWKVELALCHTLEMNCIDLGVTKAVSFCNSSRECGFSHFPYKLNGTVDCDITKASPADNKHKIKCQLTEDYKKIICTTQEECHWNPNLRFKDVNDARCVIMHNVSHCIRASPELNLTEHLNCTITPANNSSKNRTEIGDNSSNNGTETGNKVWAFLQKPIPIPCGVLFVIGIVMIFILSIVMWCVCKHYRKCKRLTRRPGPCD